MKRFVKRMLPILLCLVVICSIAWYLFSYDRAFTQELLLKSARFLEQQGNHEVATWLYRQAYLQSGNDDDVVIELANRFKEIGNYTQAEVTLSNAIADSGSVDLYMELSKVYVEQDKLMDASNMLENIINPEIKAQLEELRPEKPVANPAPGFYSQYIDVTIQAKAGEQLYVTTNGEFPSLADRYEEGIKLVLGENKIYAIAVGENGLVSAPAFYGYTVGGVIEEVNIKDPVLDAICRESLDIAPGVQLFTNDLWKITQLVVPEGVQDYSDLVELTNLESLEMSNPKLENLQVLSGLTNLKTLRIQGLSLAAKDLEIISNLPNLENLVLNDCGLSNISPLSKATKLVTLDLSRNAIQDLLPLSFMENLTTLALNNNAVTNLSAISGLTKLTTLDVSYNSLTSIGPLATCTSLSGLIINNNQITEIPLFQDPTVLTILTASNNQLTNVDNLAQYPSLVGLDLSYNQLTDIRALSELKLLVAIDFSHNQVTEIPKWSKDCLLVTVNGSYNKIRSVEPLRGLMLLNKVILEQNRITNIDPLVECQNLVQVDVYGNSIKDVSKLTELSIIVNYKPI